MAMSARQSFADFGATEYHRVCRHARFGDDTARTITGMHETYILRGSTLATPPQSRLSDHAPLRR